MDSLPQHQCLIYKGSPSKHLHAMAIAIRERLNKNFRCLYLHRPDMITQIESHLTAVGIRVQEQIAQSHLVLTSERKHLHAGRFDIDRMIELLDNALNQALRDGYQGLWASGDMSWEFGGEKNFVKLLEYEWRLEEYFRNHPALTGICQYHADSLPREVMRQGLLTHPAIFQNETLSQINPQFLDPGTYTHRTAGDAALDDEVEHLCEASLRFQS